jgi:hypothetical protein
VFTTSYYTKQEIRADWKYVGVIRVGKEAPNSMTIARTGSMVIPDN